MKILFTAQGFVDMIFRISVLKFWLRKWFELIRTNCGFRNRPEMVFVVVGFFLGGGGAVLMSG
jgi:hypothetical protein